MRVTDDENCHNRWNLTQIPTDAYCQDNKKDTSTVAPNVPKKLNIPDKDIPDDIWLQCNPYAACTMQIPFLCGFVQAQATVRNGINYPTVPAPATLETVLLLSFYTISLTGWLFTRSVCSRLCGRIKVFVKHTHNSISRLFSLYHLLKSCFSTDANIWNHVCGYFNAHYLNKSHNQTLQTLLPVERNLLIKPTQQSAE